MRVCQCTSSFPLAVSAIFDFGEGPPRWSGVPNRWQLSGVTGFNRIKVDLPVLFFQFIHSWHKQSSFWFVVVANITNFLSKCSLGHQFLWQINTFMQFCAFLFTKYSRLSASQNCHPVAILTSKTPCRQWVPFVPGTWDKCVYPISWCGRYHNSDTDVPPHSDKKEPHRRWSHQPQDSE